MDFLLWRCSVYPRLIIQMSGTIACALCMVNTNVAHMAPHRDTCMLSTFLRSIQEIIRLFCLTRYP